MSPILKGILFGIPAGLIGYVLTGAVVFGTSGSGKGKALGTRAATAMLTHPIPIVVGLILMLLTFWYFARHSISTRVLY